ncbi:FAD-binding protein [Vibrio splendidus]
MRKTKVCSWGRLSVKPHKVCYLTDRQDTLPELQNNEKVIAFGNGRSYGDVCLNEYGTIWDTRHLDRFISIDTENGILTCEAGILLRDIQGILVSYGWMLPVTPGTQMVTVGGAIANDVHCKNHHVYGSFGDHILSMVLRRTDGEVINCGPTEKNEWFKATVGGVGLTGVITKATIKLRPVPGPWLEAENKPYQTLAEFFDIADESEADWEHTVAWIDCVSGTGERGVFMRGNHIDVGERDVRNSLTLAVPMVAPISLVNRLTLRPFNMLYYKLQAMKQERSIVHYEPFFYPLDNILEWNRIYGPKGFYQYQSVVPKDIGKEAIKEMLKAISRSGDGSPLGVLKTFGERESVGLMSFPKPGITLALDFPNKGNRTKKLFNNLDAIVREAGGRLYLGKDNRMPRDLFETGYPELDNFIKFRDPGISSTLSRRLMGF